MLSGKKTEISLRYITRKHSDHVEKWITPVVNVSELAEWTKLPGMVKVPGRQKNQNKGVNCDAVTKMGLRIAKG